MDSLTQIVLGAAVGEVVLGKKIGNRALLWGAIGGTIPDLDVLSNAFMSEIDSLAFHRGISHSIVFGIFGGLFFGWLADWFYRNKYQKYLAFGAWTLSLTGIMYLFTIIAKKQSFHMVAFALGILFFVYLISRLIKTYLRGDRPKPDATIRDWQWLFFWSIFTHPLLDCFTTYGTQLFQPFSDYRVAFNAISVADPIYTIPFLLCVIICSFLLRSSKKRRIVNYTGIAISSIYLLFTVWNKSRINKVFEESLKTSNLTHNKYTTTPTILNNILWYGVADADSVYHVGHYSLFDKEKKVNFTTIKKNEQLLNASPDDYTVNKLKWFTGGYYNVITRKDGTLQLNDLRFGSVTDDLTDEDSYVFRFPLKKQADGTYVITEAIGGPPEGSEQDMMKILIKRIKGE